MAFQFSRATVVESHRSSSLLFVLSSKSHRRVTDMQQCNQAQPCGNCARRYPPPVCEYKTHNQRCASPVLLRDTLPDRTIGIVTGRGRHGNPCHPVPVSCLSHSLGTRMSLWMVSTSLYYRREQSSRCSRRPGLLSYRVQHTGPEWALKHSISFKSQQSRSTKGRASGHPCLRKPRILWRRQCVTSIVKSTLKPIMMPSCC